MCNHLDIPFHLRIAHVSNKVHVPFVLMNIYNKKVFYILRFGRIINVYCSSFTTAYIQLGRIGESLSCSVWCFVDWDIPGKNGDDDVFLPSSQPEPHSYTEDKGWGFLNTAYSLPFVQKGSDSNKMLVFGMKRIPDLSIREHYS